MTTSPDKTEAKMILFLEIFFLFTQQKQEILMRTTSPSKTKAKSVIIFLETSSNFGTERTANKILMMTLVL